MIERKLHWSEEAKKSWIRLLSYLKYDFILIVISAYSGQTISPKILYVVNYLFPEVL